MARLGVGPSVLLASLTLACGSASDGTLDLRLRGHLDLAALTAEAGGSDVRHGSGNWGYTAADGRRFALTGTSAGTSIDEVTDPRRPRHITLIPGPESQWREVKTYARFAYVTTEASHGLDVIDLRSPDRPVKAQTWSDTFLSAHTLCVDAARGLLFVNGTRDARRISTGVRVLSVADDPARPREIGSFSDFYVHDCMVRGTTLYASAINDGFLAVLDIADPTRIREVTRFFTGRRFTHNSWPTEDGRFLFTTDERPDAPVEGWDITTVTRPVKVSEFIGLPGTIPHNVMIDGTRLLVAHYTDGVHLLDVSDPHTPRPLGHYDTFTSESPGQFFDGVWGAYIFPGSNLIVASDISNGLFVLEYAGS
jgi:choice-of-anchor B domain-containing protein